MAAEDYIGFDMEGYFSSGTIYYLDKFEIIDKTEKAIQVKYKNGEVWLPKSQIKITSPPFIGMSEEKEILIIPEWLKYKNNINTERYIYDT